MQIDVNSLQGKTGARQSEFTSPSYAPLAEDGSAPSDDGPGPIRRHGSLNGFAANATALVVAGALGRDGPAVEYSGAGALRRSDKGGGEHPFGKQVDVSATADRSAWRGASAPAARGRSGGRDERHLGRGPASRAQADRTVPGGPPAGGPQQRQLPIGPDGQRQYTRHTVTAETGPAGKRRLGRFRLHPLSDEDG